MASRDMHNNIAVVHLLDAQDVAGADTNSNILDTQGFESAELLVNVGAASPLSGSVYLTPTLQHADSTANSAFTDVDADDILGAFTTIDANTEDQVTQNVGYVGVKRYVRVALVVTGSQSVTNVAVDGLLGHAFHRPAAAPSALAAT